MDNIIEEGNGYFPGNFKISKNKISNIIEILKLEKNEIKQLKRNKRKVFDALKKGDTQLAKVISLDPLLISCYSDEFDSVLIYKYPIELVKKYNLKVEQILITSNMYWPKNGLDLESDILEKDNMKYLWRDVITFIPLFICENDDYIDELTKIRKTDKMIDRLNITTNEYLKLKPNCFRDGFKTIIYF